MFQKTEAEANALAEAQRLEAALGEARQNVRRLGYGAGAGPLERETAEAAVRKIEAEMEELATSEAFLLMRLKAELNKAVAEKLPGGSLSAILALAEETLGLLDTENGQRTGDLVKSMLVRLFEACASPEVARARAKITKARYDALVETGLPEAFVQNLMVAEAGRPYPGFPSSSRK